MDPVRQSVHQGMIQCFQVAVGVEVQNPVAIRGRPEEGTSVAKIQRQVLLSLILEAWEEEEAVAEPCLHG